MRIALTIIIGLIVSLSGDAQPKKYDLKEIDQYIARQVKDKGFVGLSVAIMRDGKIVFSKGYGVRDIEKKLPVEPETAFAVGSITKQFSCACVILLAQDGKLKIDDTVAKYYPNLTKAKEITIRDLMNHTSGYPDYYPLDFLDRRMMKPISFEQLLKDYAEVKLDFEPGSRFSYSNTGYIILGGIVEKVSGMKFGEFLESRIVKPLKLQEMQFDKPTRLKNHATGYSAFALGDPEPVRMEANGWIEAAGGLWSSASDLLRWDLALVEGRAVKPESYAQMIAPRTLTTGKRSDYGFGLRASTSNGETIIGHTGGVSGFVSGNTFIPRKKAGLVVLSNTEHVAAAPLRTQLFQLLLNDIETSEEPVVPKINGPTPKAVVESFLQQLIDNNVDRKQLGEEFSFYLTEDKIKASGKRFAELGKPTKITVNSTHERGGMEVADVKLEFKTANVRASLYRTPDGKIQQLLFYKD